MSCARTTAVGGRSALRDHDVPAGGYWPMAMSWASACRLSRPDRREPFHLGVGPGLRRHLLVRGCVGGGRQQACAGSGRASLDVKIVRALSCRSRDLPRGLCPIVRAVVPVVVSHGRGQPVPRRTANVPAQRTRRPWPDGVEHRHGGHREHSYRQRDQRGGRETCGSAVFVVSCPTRSIASSLRREGASSSCPPATSGRTTVTRSRGSRSVATWCGDRLLQTSSGKRRCPAAVTVLSDRRGLHATDAVSD